MSIAVMNWIWTNSPTSGNERLVLLALADACSRDDGTGCWPAVATIARKANISVRTVQRVLDRLERDGHLIVHRGQGGAHRSTNSYTVVIHNGCQSDARQSATGDTSDTPGVTQLRHPTGDTAVTPNPPGNHQDPPPPAREPDGRAEDRPAPGGGGDGPKEFLQALGEAWPLSRGQRRRLTPRITEALADGWTPAALATEVGANPDGVRSPYAVLSSRLADLPDPPASKPPKPRWCGQCDEATRLVEHPTGDAVTRCPRCHPARDPAA